MYSYAQILKQAWKISWHYPWLWLFGLFAAALGSAGEIELIFGGFQFQQETTLLSFWQGLVQGGFFSTEGIQGLFSLTLTSPLSLFLITFILLLMLAITVVAVWLIVVSQAALISQTVAISRNKDYGFREGVSVGMSKFLPVFAINVILRVFGAVLLILLNWLAMLSFPGMQIIYVIIFDIFLILLLLFSFAAKYAICGVVLREWTLKDAPKKGFALFKKNWLVTSEIALIVFFIYLVVTVFVGYIISQIFIFSVFTFATFTIGLMAIFVLLLLLFVAVQIILTLFHWAVWTIVFEILTSPKQSLSSKFRQIFNRT